MNIEREKIIETEKNNSEINLDNLKTSFWSEKEIENWYVKNNFKEFNIWYNKNKKTIEDGKDEIKKAIEKGLIENDNPETLYSYQKKRFEESKEKTISTKNEIENNFDDIKFEVVKLLENFLPDWKLKESEVKFLINKKANFCLQDKLNILVDLQRLTWEENPKEETIKGLAHELFHVWTNEKGGSKHLPEKEKMLYASLNEGLAVLISGQSLEKHHEKQGKNFDLLKKESFEKFVEFLKKGNEEEIEKGNEGFKNTGYFYVVGNEIVKTILETKGTDYLKELIINFPKNFNLFFNEYKKICKSNDKLLKI